MKMKLLFALTFFFQVAFSQNHDILITEILADPTPSIGLPEREYIEIFNNTENAISLKGFKLFYGNFSAFFPDSVLLPQTYYIVCRRGFELDFRNFGKVIALSNFSLPNDGTLLIIKNQKDELVHYVDYKLSWYKNVVDGGISLEMINPANACLSESNWAASKSTMGGTPGKQNSVSSSIRDTSQSRFLSYSLVEKMLTVTFDKNLSTQFLLDKTNFDIIEGDLKIENVTFNPYKRNEFAVHLNATVDVGQNAVLRIKTLEDCLGNIGEDLDVDFSNLLPAELGEILLSEILFNPKPGGEDFVEIYNNSGKSLNLKNWKIANVDEAGAIKDIKLLIGYDFKLLPKSHLAFTTNVAFLMQNYPKSGKVLQVESLPAFNNDKGEVILLNQNSEEFDRFQYSEKMHHGLLVNPEGVSLERSSFEKNSSWLSASEDAGFATPGADNSQKLTDDLQDSFSAEPYIFNPYQGSDISKTFLKYKVTNPGIACNIDIVDKSGRHVRKLASNAILGTSGEIEWDGKGDSGQILPVGYYLFKISTYSNSTKMTFFAKCVLGSY